MTHNEFLVAYEAANLIDSRLVALLRYVDSCKHTNGFLKRIERIERDFMEYKVDLWNAAHDSSKWSS